MFKIDSINALTIIRNSLRVNLTDPYVLAGGTRGTNIEWCWLDEPVAVQKYPMIQLEKIDNPTRPISIGQNYWEEEKLFINIWFYSKHGFKLTISGTEYVNAPLVEYYLGKIKTTLKSQFSALHTAGVGSYKHINTTKVDYDPQTQLYYGAVTIGVRYFIAGC